MVILLLGDILRSDAFYIERYSIFRTVNRTNFPKGTYHLAAIVADARPEKINV